MTDKISNEIKFKDKRDLSNRKMMGLAQWSYEHVIKNKFSFVNII